MPKAKKKSRNGSILFRGMKVIIRRLELKGMTVKRLLLETGLRWRKEG